MGTSFYLLRSTWWMKMLWPAYAWEIKTREKKLYLSFDDGPEPLATPFVLDELKKYNARASFFCIGENVQKHPGIYNRIIEEGHSVGNHTQHHLNGWKTKTRTYLEDVSEASGFIQSSLFRPPYGRINGTQAKLISQAMGVVDARIIMWSVLSGDFDTKRSGEACLDTVKRYARPGSIIVFHDSEKAFPSLSYALPRTLEHFSALGYSFEKIEKEILV